jgi:RHH-type proline utilization regulon transcriptional repressor/proline dehydrogenase/delta 1-pyrroline-5-carboxylate dehydrogenase
MLEGMANHVWRAQKRLGNHVILYTPVVKKENFLNAISYLVRRMDENTAPDNFLTHSFSLRPDTEEWRALQQQFTDAYRMKDHLDHTPTRTQDRNQPYQGQASQEEFHFEPDTDFDRRCNQQWVEKIMANPGADVPPAKALAADGSLWAVANRLGELRGALCGMLCKAVSKTVEEADAEVSAAMDYCRYYAVCMKKLEALGDLEFQPRGTAQVAATWNAPCAAPIGSIAAALATGNSCTLKTDALAAPVARLYVQAFYDAGVAREVLTLVDLTPSSQPTIPEGYKNAIILTAKGDRGHAIMNACHSAFTGAGQKAASCSLLLVERSVYESADFFEKLKDCASSLMCGPVSNTGNIVGPMISSHNERLQRALQLDEGERWLLEPTFVDEEHRILRPTVKVGVRPGSYSFTTPLAAPLLSVAPFDTLEEAVGLVNSLPRTLTSGLQSLDEEEQRYWKNNVRAGNLYINRGITGAVVGRQPFGPLASSAAGPAYKSGGPNYLLQFLKIQDKKGEVQDFKRSYAEWYEREFAHARNLHPEIRGEQNIVRYLPYSDKGMVLRLIGDESVEQVQMVIEAARIVGTPLTVSVDESHPIVEKMMNCQSVNCKYVTRKFESLAVFCNSIKEYDCVRTIAASVPSEILEAAAAANKYVETAKPVSNGRIELTRFLREQTIVNEYHRYGSQIEVPPVE